MADLAEPVKVRDVSAEATAAAAQFRRLRADVDGCRCKTHDEIDTVVKLVAGRLGQMSVRERDALLVMLTIERLTGVRDKAAVTVPSRLLKERLARSDETTP